MELNLDRLKQEMQTLEWVITRLLSLKMIPTTHLERKLTDLAESIQAIPAEYSELVDQWSDKMARMLTMYSSASMAQAIDVSYNLPNKTTKNDEQIVENDKEENDQNSYVSLAETFESLDSNLASLEHQLQTIDSSIAILLTLCSPPIVLLVRKLSELVEMIERIPVEHSDLRDLWNDKVAIWLKKYSVASVDANKTTASSDIENISSKTKPNSKLDSLLHSLTNLESAIILLLSIDSPPKEIIEIKLSNLIRLIGDIPHDCDELTFEWSGKIAVLMQKYAQLSVKREVENAYKMGLTRPLSIEDIRQYTEHVPTPEKPFLTDLNLTNNSSNSSQMNHVPSENGLCGDSVVCLAQELDCLEKDISQLLAQYPKCKAILEVKVVELVALVQDIPKELTEMFNKWNDKVVQLMVSFSIMASTSKIEESHSQPASEPQSQAPILVSMLLEHELHNLESQIYRLLSATSPSIILLDGKVGELMKEIKKLAKDSSVNHEIITEWREKVAVWRNIVHSLPSQQCKDHSSIALSTEEYGLHLTCSTEELRNWLNSESYHEHGEEQQKSEQTVLNTFDNSNCIENKFPIDLSENSHLLKEVVLSKLEKAFSCLQLINSNDTNSGIEEIRQLLSLVAKARVLADVFRPDGQLPKQVIDWAVNKLPEQFREEYFLKYKDSKYKIPAFGNYLAGKLVEQYNSVNMKQHNDQKELMDNSGDSGLKLNYCNYCKKGGHRLADCTKRMLILCFRCFDYGHNMKYCHKGDFARPEDLLNSL